MRLLFTIIIPIVAIALCCVAGAAAWVMIDTTRAIEREAAASTDRVVREAQALAWKELTWRGSEGRYAKLAFPDWRSSDTLKVIAQGHCVALTWTNEATLTTCSGSAALGAPAPDWFAALYGQLFGRTPSVSRVVILNQRPAGLVVTTPEWIATTTRVWRQFRIVIAVTAAIVASISALSALVIGYALHPASVIVTGLRRLQAGDYAERLPQFRSAEFRQIAIAVNDLQRRLAEVTAERAELTRKLFVAQEEERLSLARDLHDEFGQCLTATAALASAISATVPPERADIVEDARLIRGNVARMMASLKECIVRLRPPELAQVGLMGSLSTLVTRWNAQNSGRTAYHLEMSDDFTALEPDVAICVYRIAQECLTNASKHGAPARVSVSLTRGSGGAAPGDSLDLVVEDDGGGDPDRILARPGHGIVGIRERLSTLGGDLSIGRSAQGVRLRARIPLGGSPMGKSAPSKSLPTKSLPTKSLLRESA